MDGKTAQSGRFTTLDGLRGVAAVCVMLFHAGDFSPLPMPGGYLAVDLFFALSGFVLAHAYDERLRAGMAPREFAWRRLARVYPMYLTGALLGALLIHGSAATLLMVPAIGGSNMLYPGNVPMWSLAMELVVNVAFGLCAVRLGRRGLALVLLASGTALATATLRHGGIDFGASWADVHLGLLRTLFSFAVGVALCRVRAAQGMKRRRGWPAFALLPLLAVLLWTDPAARAPWDLACVFVLFPALVWLGSKAELPRARLAGALGDLSYPLYCIHYPFVRITSLSGMGMGLLMAGLIAAAWALDRRVDRPARRLLLGWVEQACARPAAT